jgi:transporter family-2 protein
MKWLLLVPIAVGFATVIQGGLNRQISSSLGLPLVAILSTAVLLFAAVALWIAVRINPENFSTLFRMNTNEFHWWYLVPGLFGFIIVIGIPFSIEKIGALNSFIAMIAAQIAGSMLWDLLIEHRSITPLRLVCAILAFISAALTVV